MERKNAINIDANNINSKFQFIVYVISSIIGIIFAVLIFKKVNIPQNSFDSQAEIHTLKAQYMIILFLLYLLCYKIGILFRQNSVKQGKTYLWSPIFTKADVFISMTLLLLFIYLWLFLPDHFFLFICFATYQLYLLLLLSRFKNKQLLIQVVIYVVISLVLTILHFLIFKTPNFVYVLTCEEFSSAAAYILITIVLTTILFNGTNQRGRKSAEIGGEMCFSLVLIIFNLILLKHTYYQFGEGETFAVKRNLCKTIALILPLIISFYFLRFAEKKYLFPA